MSDHKAEVNPEGLVEGSVNDHVEGVDHQAEVNPAGLGEGSKKEQVEGGVAALGVKVEVKTEGDLVSDLVSDTEQASVTMASFSKSNEPPTFISERKSYAEYKTDLKMWSRITSVPKKNQAEVVVYNLDGHPSRVKEKIVLNVGNDIQESEDGIKKLIEYLDTI